MAWSAKYKRSIDCNNPKGYSQRAHCAGKMKRGRKKLQSGGSKSEGLRKWFARNSGRGWVDCKASSAAGKFVPCGRKSKSENRKTGYPACRPTMSACTRKGMAAKKSTQRVSWKNKKS